MSIVFVMVYILLISHLSTAKDMPDTMKVGGWVVFGIMGVLYVVFGMVL